MFTGGARMSPSHRLEDVEAERARRAALEAQGARRSEGPSLDIGLLAFTKFRMPPYRASRVHRLICEQLERVERREIDRLMLLVCPRHGKSELASKSYPAWCIGRAPWKQFISGSASMPLALDWGREVRNIVNSHAYRMIYNTRLSADSHTRSPNHEPREEKSHA